MTELTVTIVPPFSEERRPGRNVWRMWKWERRFVWIVLVMALVGRERRGEPLIEVAAQFMMIVGVPSCCQCQLKSPLSLCDKKFFVVYTARVVDK
jgi:hypothetical protein